MSGKRLAQLTRASACGVLFAVLSWATPPQAAVPTSPSPEEFWAWAKEKAKALPALDALLREVDTSYEVVFIPGILGSKLNIDGKYVYGEDEIDSSKLAYRPGQKVVATPLETFKSRVLGVNFASTDIYGEALNGLSVAVTTGKPVHVFAYDWRQDIDESAAQLHQYLNRYHAKKRIVLIAHSMGGLVAWRWKQMHYPGDSQVRIVSMMLAGSPLQGTCEAVRMIAGGYGAPAGSPKWESAAISVVFRDSHAAVLTFPSVFQLLPKFGSELSPCIKIPHAGSQYPKDHHEPLTWLKRHGTHGTEATAEHRLKAFAQQANLPAATYAKLVLSAIAAGKRFRKDFSPDHDGGNLVLLYSEARSLAPFHLITQEERWVALYQSRDTFSGLHPGDGRVLAESAKNGYTSERNIRRFGKGVRYARLHSEHGNLVNDPDLHAFLRDHLRQWIEEDRHLAVEDFALGVPELRREMQAKGWIRRPSMFVFANDSMTRDRAARISLNNMQVALGGISNVHPATLAYIRSELKVDSWSSPSPRDAVAVALLESAVILEPGPASIDSLALMGSILARQERHPEAVVALESASYWNSKEALGAASTTRTTKIYSTLARAYEKIGEKESATMAAFYSDPLFRGPLIGDNRATPNIRNFVWQPLDRRQYERLVGQRKDDRI
jgi:pimeloyl-ACP methyl ester carboxylesterase